MAEILVQDGELEEEALLRGEQARSGDVKRMKEVERTEDKQRIGGMSGIDPAPRSVRRFQFQAKRSPRRPRGKM